jgi:predicted DNA-binding protein
MSEKKHPTDRVKAFRQPRASVTFPPKLYRVLEALAKEKKVSLAWIVREAAEVYVASQSDRSSAKAGKND